MYLLFWTPSQNVSLWDSMIDSYISPLFWFWLIATILIYFFVVPYNSKRNKINFYINTGVSALILFVVMLLAAYFTSSFGSEQKDYYSCLITLAGNAVFYLIIYSFALSLILTFILGDFKHPFNGFRNKKHIIY